MDEMMQADAPVLVPPKKSHHKKKFVPPDHAPDKAEFMKELWVYIQRLIYEGAPHHIVGNLLIEYGKVSGFIQRANAATRGPHKAPKALEDIITQIESRQ